MLRRKMPCRSVLLVALIISPQLSGVAAPSPAAAPPSAPPPSSSAAIESQVLAFKEADQLAARIVSKVCDAHIADGSTIVIYDQATFASLQSFEAFVANIKVLTASYETLIPDLLVLTDRLKRLAKVRQQGDLATKPGELAEHLKSKREFLALGPIDPFSDLTALLSAVAVSSNVETPSSVVIPDSSIAIALTSGLRRATPCSDHKQPFNVIYPPLFGKSSTSDFASADLEVNIQILQDVRQFAHEVVYTNVKDHSAKDKNLGDANAVLTKALTDIDGLYDNFMNSLLQPNAGSGVIGSASVIQGIRLITLLKGDSKKPDSTYVLLASVVGAGGTERVHKTFWTALGHGDKITYSGGLITNVAMWKSTGGNSSIAELMYSKSAFKNADGATQK